MKIQSATFQTGTPPWDSLSDLCNAVRSFGLHVRCVEIYDGDENFYLVSEKELTDAQVKKHIAVKLEEDFGLDDDEIGRLLWVTDAMLLG